MSEEKDDLKNIKVYKFNNTKENWYEFALKFKVIADTTVESLMDLWYPLTNWLLLR